MISYKPTAKTVPGDLNDLFFGMVIAKRYQRSQSSCEYSGVYKIWYLTPTGEVVTGIHYNDLEVLEL